MNTFNRSVDLSFCEQSIFFTDIKAPIAFEKTTKVYIEIENIEEKAQLLVAIGDEVKTGQIIAQYKNKRLPKIIATATGKIKSITAINQLSNFDRKISALEIEVNNQEQNYNLYQSLGNQFKDFNWQNLSQDQINNLIQNAGIIGMGGAGFPTHLKIKPVNHLIINGVECDPLIFSDICLMKYKAKEIIEGIQILTKSKITQENTQFHLAIKEKYADFLNELIQYIEQYNNNELKHKIKIHLLSNNYPSGGELQVIEQIFNIEIAKNKLPIDYGFLSLNVGTIYAIAEAIKYKKACSQRIVTIYNKQTKKLKNYLIKIGTSLTDIIQAENLDPKEYFCIIGGPMMGFEVANNNAVVSRITNCIQIIPNKEKTLTLEFDDCIRCGACSDYCPVRLLPQELYWSIKNEKDSYLKNLNLFDCIECGICDYVCPSDIPLLQHFRFAKEDLRVKEEKRNFSDTSKQRFDFREFRLEQIKQQRAQKLEEKKKMLKMNANQTAEKKEQIKQALQQVNDKK